MEQQSLYLQESNLFINYIYKARIHIVREQRSIVPVIKCISKYHLKKINHSLEDKYRIIYSSFKLVLTKNVSVVVQMAHE